MEIQDAAKGLVREMNKFSDLVKEDLHRLDLGAGSFLDVLYKDFSALLKMNKKAELAQAENQYGLLSDLSSKLRKL